MFDILYDKVKDGISIDCNWNIKYLLRCWRSL